MKIENKEYDINQLREKMPLYDMFSPKKIESGSQEDILDKDPIATTNPNLHMRFDKSEQIKRGPGEVSDRKYVFLGLIGTQAYSYIERYLHDEDDEKKSEKP